MKIIIYPDLELRKKSQSIKKSDLAEINKFLPEFIEMMEKKDGVGLACPQIGKNIKLFVTKVNDQVQVFINPLIFWRSWSRNVMEEGCLSIPDVYGLVTRPVRVWLTYQNEHGQRKFLKTDALLARVIQHEYDHLFGRLFIDKVSEITQGQKNLNKLLEKNV